MDPRIIAISGALKGSIFRLTESDLLIGRDTTNHICLDEDTVSRRHCAISLQNNHARLSDRESRNGTFVNGRAYLDKELDHGDRIKFGSSTFLYLEYEESPGDIPAYIDAEREQNRRLQTLRVDRSVDDAAVSDKDVVRVLLRVIPLIDAIPDRDLLQARLLELMFEIVPARRGAFLLNGHQPSPDDFVSRTWREQGFDGSAPFPLSSKILGEVYSERVPMMTNDLIPVLCVPLMVSGRICGVIYAEGADARSGFDPDHLRYLKFFADAAAVAFRLSRHVESIETEKNLLKGQACSEHEMIGRSAAIERVRSMMRKAAESAAPVLILGPSGTGKELVAWGIHMSGERAERPIIAVNCGAFTETLLLSEFFGHEKGSFTGANSQQKGKIELADGGTLFLDEATDMPLLMQVALLRFLESGEFRRVGGTRTMKSDVRVIAATNISLEDAVKAGKFREDLYYRLNVLQIETPSLAERSEDIPLLAAHIIAKYRGRRRITGIQPDAMALMMSYDWPGNVRELKSTIIYAVDMGDSGGEYICSQDLPRKLTEHKPPQVANATLKGAKKEITKTEVQRALAETKNMREAARRLGISLSYAYRQKKRLT